MQAQAVAAIFEVLSSEARLAIFRLLVKHAPGGLVAGEIAQALGIPKTNLSFHLKALVHGGLAGMQRVGRHTRYRANMALMLQTIAYLTSECCSGQPAQPEPRGADAGAAPACCPSPTTPQTLSQTTANAENTP